MTFPQKGHFFRKSVQPQIDFCLKTRNELWKNVEIRHNKWLLSTLETCPTTLKNLNFVSKFGHFCSKLKVGWYVENNAVREKAKPVPDAWTQGQYRKNIDFWIKQIFSSPDRRPDFYRVWNFQAWMSFDSQKSPWHGRKYEKWIQWPWFTYSIFYFRPIQATVHGVYSIGLPLCAVFGSFQSSQTSRMHKS